MNSQQFSNPFRPGAGHMPPCLAGRDKEKQEFIQLLGQEIIIENIVLTGLRGVGKTVLLETFKPLAIEKKWLWVGTDLSESASINEETLALRLIVDMSVVTSNLVVNQELKPSFGFSPQVSLIEQKLNYNTLVGIYNSTPGLVSDKLKSVLELVWNCMVPYDSNGIIFAYDEAQTLSDHSQKEQYPLSLLLDIFQSIQRKEIPFMLVLTGLPTLFPKLVEARTFSERMFRVVYLDKLNEEESRDAITKPISGSRCPIHFTEDSVSLVTKESDGYPYFIQFICKEVYDVFLQNFKVGEDPEVPIGEITRKLDKDFFAGRWAKATDRQRELLFVIAHVKSSHMEFTVQKVVEKSKELLKNSFSSSHVNQMLHSLTNAGLVYKNRHGKYSFAVPLLGKFILRQEIETFSEDK
jgi:hypothetical protein